MDDVQRLNRRAQPMRRQTKTHLAADIGCDANRHLHVQAFQPNRTLRDGRTIQIPSARKCWLPLSPKSVTCTTFGGSAFPGSRLIDEQVNQSVLPGQLGQHALDDQPAGSRRVRARARNVSAMPPTPMRPSSSQRPTLAASVRPRESWFAVSGITRSAARGRRNEAPDRAQKFLQVDRSSVPPITDGQIVSEVIQIRRRRKRHHGYRHQERVPAFPPDRTATRSMACSVDPEESVRAIPGRASDSRPSRPFPAVATVTP